MVKSYKQFLLVLWILVLLPIPAFAGESQLLDRVVAVVNNEAITQSELDALLMPVYEQYRKEFQGQTLAQKMNDARTKLLNQLIEDRLVYQEASKEGSGIEVNETEITNQFEEVKKQIPPGQSFEDMLSVQGLSVSEFKQRIRRQTMIRRLQDKEIRSRVVVSPSEIETYYKEHSAEFSDQEQIKIRSLTVKKNFEAKEKGLTDEGALNKIKELRQKIQNGEAFASIATQFSEDTRAKDGGMSDWIKRGEMIPEIDKVIFSMKVGDTSEMVETSMGYHLFQVVERKEAYKRKLEEVRDDIHATLYRKKFQDRFNEWMNELKRNAYISIH